MATDRVLVGALDLVGRVGEERDAGELQLAQHRLPGQLGPEQLLVGARKVRLERVDGFQPDRDTARSDVGAHDPIFGATCQPGPARRVRT